VTAINARTPSRDAYPEEAAAYAWPPTSTPDSPPTATVVPFHRPSVRSPGHGGPGRRSPAKRALNREDVRALLRAYHERGDRHARELVIQQYMPLVKSLARRHSNRGELYEDLVQVGAIGLIKAVDRFDAERKVDFGAFAIPTISGEIKRYLRDRAWPIKVPRRLQELRPGLCACSAELASQLERPATIAEIAQRAGVDEPEVEAALAIEQIRSPLSLSTTPLRDGADCSVDIEGVFDGGFELGEQRAVLAAGFRVLTARERRLLHLRFFAGLSQPQIAREVGISQIHVSRLTRRALEKLRTHIGPIEGQPPLVASEAG
jgi:RNA polymerase sigma-B factor